jgi:hypothetical protein
MRSQADRTVEKIEFISLEYLEIQERSIEKYKKSRSLQDFGRRIHFSCNYE